MRDVGIEGEVLIKGTPGGRHTGDRGAQFDKGQKLADEIIQRQSRLERYREYQDSLWDDVDSYGTSRRAKYDIGSKSGATEDLPAGADIYDQTSQASIRDFCDGWQSQTANAVVKWWSARFRNKDINTMYDAKRWLDDVEEILTFEMANSNFYEQINTAYQDGTSHGIATMVGPEWDHRRNKFFVLERHPREIFVATDWNGEVNLWHRKFLLTGRQILEAFGPEGLPVKFLKGLTSSGRNLYRHYVVIHAIFQRTERDITSPLRVDMPWASVYVLEEQKVVLDEGGYMPMDLPDTWRWFTDATYPYGTSPLIDALRDVMGTNSATKSMLWAAQLAVRPPLIMTKEMKGRVRLTPNGETYLQGPQDRVQAFQYPTQFQVGMEQVAEMRAEIRNRFKANIFQLQSELGGKITAFQANLVQGEKAAALIPITTRAAAQLLVPKVNKFFHAAVKAGRIPAPPPSVMRHANTPVDIEMIGPMAVAAKRFLSQQGFNAFLAMLAEIDKVMPSVGQQIGEAVNADELRKFLTDGDGTPQKIFLSDEQLMAIREMKQKLIQQEQQRNALGQVADMYNKAKEAPQQGSPAQLMGIGK